MQTFKALGLLLTYPEGSLYRASGEIVDLLRTEALLPRESIDAVALFLSRQKGRDLLDAQEEYVETFDRGRAHCLHLFEHVHGESRDRGQAMVDLSETYASKGLYINNNELPDYLPLFMEYLSRCAFAEASALLGEAIDVIATVGAKLRKAGSPYAVVFAAVEKLSAAKPDSKRIKEAVASSPKDPQTLAQLDEQWREAEAFGGDPAAEACNSCDGLVYSNQEFKKWLEVSR